ncbi:hypothetical protein PSTT_05684 [Puccinia striiformis]|uniref:Uncharacterized protein n=1 Tax=Puccinia striiformis TaxID=27350 RepID=A0A2S4VNC0_9BASI|nr:hypothetical protein PSTT_05684 [Puccinia striiformis]
MPSLTIDSTSSSQDNESHTNDSANTTNAGINQVTASSNNITGIQSECNNTIQSESNDTTNTELNDTIQSESNDTIRSELNKTSDIQSECNKADQKGTEDGSKDGSESNMEVNKNFEFEKLFKTFNRTNEVCGLSLVQLNQMDQALSAYGFSGAIHMGVTHAPNGPIPHDQPTCMLIPAWFAARKGHPDRYRFPDCLSFRGMSHDGPNGEGCLIVYFQDLQDSTWIMILQTHS